MSNRVWTKQDAKMIAEAAADCADRAAHWKARALAAEEALRCFAAEIYAIKPDKGPAGATATVVPA